MRQFTTILLLGVLVLAVGCVSHPGVARIQGKFLNPDTGTYAVFQDNGRFYYSFTSSTPVLGSDGLPRRLGFYGFERAADTTPYLTLNSFDALQFTIRFSESRDRFYLTYPSLFTGERVYERIPEK